MKVLQFTIPVAHDKSVIVEQVELPYHYPYLHRHKEAQITLIQQGEGTLIAGNNMHDFKPGDVFFIGANQPHLFKSNPEYFNEDAGLRIRALTIFFNPDGILTGLFDLPETKPIKTFLQQHQQGFKIAAGTCPGLIRLMDEIKDSMGIDQLMQFLNMLKQLLQISDQLEPLSSYGGTPNITDSEGIRIGNIYNFIMQHYNDAITLDDVAKIAYMTPESFCRYFKKHTGHTFISFLNEVRINEACKKLSTHQFEGVAAVAYQCGFKSITNFNRVFKSITGTSPRQYLDKMSQVIKL